MKALAKNPANRYQSAQELSEDLERVKQGQDVQATPLMPPGGDATQVISRAGRHAGAAAARARERAVGRPGSAS